MPTEKCRKGATEASQVSQGSQGSQGWLMLSNDPTSRRPKWLTVHTRSLLFDSLTHLFLLFCFETKAHIVHISYYQR